MSTNRQQLHALINMVDESDIETLYNVFVRFIPEAEAAPDEAEAIKQARAEFERGEYVRHEDINWN